MKASTKLTVFLILMMLIFALPFDSMAQGNSKGKGGPPPWAPAHGYKSRQVYFPDHNFYFDTQKNVYIYPSGSSWQISVNIPSIYASFNLTTALKVELNLDTDSPQKYNTEHVTKYKVKKEKSNNSSNGNSNNSSSGKSNNSSKGKNK